MYKGNAFPPMERLFHHYTYLVIHHRRQHLAMSCHSVQENVDVESTEARQKRKEMEHQRAEALLCQHVRFAQRIKMEEEVRLACNDLLLKYDFPLVKRKSASVGRPVDSGDKIGVSEDEACRMEWYGMSGYQSKGLALLFEFIDVSDNW